MAGGRSARRLAAPVLVLALAACSSSLTLTTVPTVKASLSGLRPVAVGETPDLTLSGDLRRVEVHSNRGDKEILVAYYTAFVVTAPLAALVYGLKDWQADAAAEGTLVALDRSGATVWTRDLTVSISENQRTLPEDAVLKSTMNRAVCEKLATTLFNALAEALATARR